MEKLMTGALPAGDDDDASDQAPAPKAKTKAAAFGRRLADLRSLSPAERRLVVCAAAGEVWVASQPEMEGQRHHEPAGRQDEFEQIEIERQMMKHALDKQHPNPKDCKVLTPQDVTIRAAVVRFLALGGDDEHPVHERGVNIRGAYIPDEIDLTGCSDVRILRLEGCELKGMLKLEYARTSSIFLDHSSVERIDGTRAHIDGSIYMRFNFEARDGVDLSGINVTGSVSCRGGVFKKKADRKHAFRVDDAAIGGSLIIGPRHEKDLADQTNGTSMKGRVSFNGTRCATLIDHPDTYKGLDAGALEFHGFRYGRLGGIESEDPDFRAGWLEKQVSPSDYTGFSPESFEYLAGVLREMGREAAARRVLIKRRELQHKANQHRRKVYCKSKGPFFSRQVIRIVRVVSTIWNRVFYSLARYGYQPARAMAYSVVPVLAGWLVFGLSYATGDMVPTKLPDAARKQWDACRKQAEDFKGGASFTDGALAIFTGQPTADCMAGDPALKVYPRFNPLLYSVDTFLPIVQLRQSESWMPASDATNLARWYLPLNIALGYLLVTLGLSGMLGHIHGRAAPGVR